MTEPITDPKPPSSSGPAASPPLVFAEPAAVDPATAINFTAAAQPSPDADSAPSNYQSKPVQQVTVQALQYLAPDGTQGGNIPALLDFVGDVVPQPSFNVSTGQTCVHVCGQLTQPWDYVVRHGDGGVEVLAADAFAEQYDPSN